MHEASRRCFARATHRALDCNYHVVHSVTSQRANGVVAGQQCCHAKVHSPGALHACMHVTGMESPLTRSSPRLCCQCESLTTPMVGSETLKLRCPLEKVATMTWQGTDMPLARFLASSYAPAVRSATHVSLGPELASRPAFQFGVLADKARQ
jgi:hypothetical protein